MDNLVTIGIPVYKRLEYLPSVLNIVASQDYPNIELLVSDNGMNGTAVPDILNKHYPKPYRFRQNDSSVSASMHFTQLIENAVGEYFIVLADDDEISPNYVSELVAVLKKYPQASVALATEENIDEAGTVIRKSADTVPDILSGPDFVRAVWGTHEYGFQSLCTFLAKTEKLQACGGFPDIWAATSDEDLLITKLCLDNFVAFSRPCAFRKRVYESSGGYSISLQDLARGIHEFTACLNSDPQLLAYGALHPVEWKESKLHLTKSAWDTYYYRWATIYKERLRLTQWIKAAYALPPSYHRTVVRNIGATLFSKTMAPLKKRFPQTYERYRAAKTRVRS